MPHKAPGYVVVTVSLKAIGAPPGDASADQMDAVADLAEDYSHDEVRVSHEQNLILPHVALDDLPAVYDRLASVGLSTPNAGLISDIIACPGLDYCALATARSIPIAQRIAQRFGDGARARAIGPLKIKISGCINACGHHHVGHIGILGLERAGEETYQITLGGSGDETGVDRPDRRPRLQFGERRRRGRDDRRHLYRPAARRGRDLPRRLPPGRHGAVQGGALRTKRRIGHLMSAHDVKLFGDQIAASRLETRFARLKATSLLRLAIEDLYPGRIALVSSFGADAAALLHMVAQIDAATPVIFVDTGQHFPETLAYRDALCDTLRLTNVIVATPDAEVLAAEDPEKFLFASDPDRCCDIRKVRPLAEAMEGYRRLDHRPQGLPEHDALEPAAVRGGGRAGQGQSAGRLERDRRAQVHRGGRPAAPSAGRQGLSRRSAACLARARSNPARTSAPAAGAAAAKSNAAFMSARSTRETASDAVVAARGLRRRRVDRSR